MRFLDLQGARFNQKTKVAKRAGPPSMGKREYVQSNATILETPELEKLELVIELYEREQQGIRITERDEEEIKSNIYKRLGKLLGIEPNTELLGEREHGRLLADPDANNRFKMLGMIFDDLLKRHFKGEFDLRIKQEEKDDGIDPALMKPQSKENIIERNVL